MKHFDELTIKRRYNRLDKIAKEISVEEDYTVFETHSKVWFNSKGGTAKIGYLDLEDLRFAIELYALRNERKDILKKIGR